MKDDNIERTLAVLKSMEFFIKRKQVDEIGKSVLRQIENLRFYLEKEING